MTRPLLSRASIVTVISAALLLMACGGKGSDDPPEPNPTGREDSGIRDSAVAVDATALDASPDATVDSGDPTTNPRLSCEGMFPCDPIADTGCGAGLHCMVDYTEALPSASCDVAGTGRDDGASAFDPCPCQVGFACTDIGCMRICDPSIPGGGDLAPTGMMGQFDSPDCASSSWGPDCVSGSPEFNDPERCFGRCDTIFGGGF